MNLLKETKQILAEHGKTTNDINWIGSQNGKYIIDWLAFVQIANKEYYQGYGGNEVNESLVIVGHDNWWLERSTYDGAEWWSFKTKPKLHDTPKQATDVFVEDFSDNWEARHA